MITCAIESQYDCLVIGGAPAGCTAATLVAEAGFKTLRFERDQVPRFHVGDSLMPETYWSLRRLGLISKLKKASIWGHLRIPMQHQTVGGMTSILHTTGKRAWFWHIPLDSERVSVGLVSG